jgi:hypothetical protein
LRVVPTFKAPENNRDAALRLFRCVDAAWAVAAYPGYRRKLVEAAANAFRDVGQYASGVIGVLARSEAALVPLQKPESAAIAACALAASLTGDVTSRGIAVNSAMDAAEQNGTKRGLEQMFVALTVDALHLDEGTEPVALANSQLWPMPAPATPDWVRDAWEELSATLKAVHDEHWEIWTGWDENRLRGNTTDTDLEIAVATTVPDSAWNEGPKSVNTFIRQRLLGANLSSGSNRPRDPRNIVAIQQWLTEKPQEWTTVIAARAALRLLPGLIASPGDTTLLAIFRAISAARYAVLHPQGRNIASDAADFLRDRGTETARAAFYAASAAGAADSPNRAIEMILSELDSRNDPLWILDILNDSSALDSGATPQALAREPLWSAPTQGGYPPLIQQAWRNLAQTLHEQGSHWHVWVDWYDYILEGSPPAAQRDNWWEAAFVDMPWALPWEAGAQSVNTEIAARLRAPFDSPTETAQPDKPPQIPAQGYGPHFEIRCRHL